MAGSAEATARRAQRRGVTLCGTVRRRRSRRTQGNRCLRSIPSLKPNIDNERLVSRYQDIINDVNNELQEITNELKYKKNQWLKRRKLNKQMELKKNQKAYLEKQIESKEITEHFRDVLEQLKTEPIRNFKE